MQSTYEKLKRQIRNEERKRVLSIIWATIKACRERPLDERGEPITWLMVIYNRFKNEQKGSEN